MRNVILFSRLILSEQRSWFLLGAVASLAALLSAIALLALAGWFIAAAAMAGAVGAGLTFDFFRPSAGIRFLALGRTASRYGERLLTHDATLRFFASLRSKLFVAIASHEKYSRRLRSSELLQRLTADLDAIDTLYLRVLLPILVGLSVLVLATAMLWNLSWLLALVVAIAFSLAGIVFYAGSRATLKESRRLASGSESLRIRIVDLVHTQADLHFAGRLEAQREKVAGAARYLAAAARRLAYTETVVWAAVSLIGTGLLVALFVLAARAYEARELSAPVLTLLVIGGFAALEVFLPLRRGVLEFGRILFSSRRLAPLTAIGEKRDVRILFGAPAVKIRHLSYRHGTSGTFVLDDFCLDVRPGERVALVGKSGAGKSTVLNLIAGLTIPENGELIIHAPGSTRAAVGYLTQETELFNSSVAENLRLARPEASDDELWAALGTVELDTKIAGLPGKLSFVLGESGNGLSGGELRRLALARLVLRNPSIWLMDEPTAAMDEALGQRVMKNLADAATESTWILAAHHRREIEFADRVVRVGEPAPN